MKITLTLILLLPIDLFAQQNKVACDCIVYPASFTVNCNGKSSLRNIHVEKFGEHISFKLPTWNERGYLKVDYVLLDSNGRAEIKASYRGQISYEGLYERDTSSGYKRLGLNDKYAKEHGIWKYYNEKGQLNRTVTYYFGKETSVIQHRDCEPGSVYLSEYATVFYAHFDRTTKVRINEDTTIRFFLKDCRCGSTIQVYKKRKLIVQGEYGSAGKTIPDFQYFRRVKNDEGWVDNMFECMVPVKDGQWTYYDLAGKKIKTEIYKSDTLISTVNH